jgi:cytochrome c2
MIGLGVAALVAVSGQAAQAAGDAAAGQKVFTTQCKTCHSAEPNKHMTGPSLFGIYGAKAGSTTFPRYKGLVAADFVWDDAKLMEYLTDPKAFVTKYTKNTTTAMTFKLGEGKEQQREDVIAYLKTLK